MTLARFLETLRFANARAVKTYRDRMRNNGIPEKNSVLWIDQPRLATEAECRELLGLELRDRTWRAQDISMTMYDLKREVYNQESSQE